MSSKLLLILVAVTLAVGAFFVLRDPGPDTPDTRVTSAAEAAPEATTAARGPETLELDDEPLTEEPAALVAEEPGRVEVVPGSRPVWAQKDAVELRGQVLFPAGLPGDELAFVTVQLQGDLASTEYAVEVDPAGSFAFFVPPNTGSVQLELDARYLFLDEPVQAAPEQPIVLAPRLGAWLTGTIVLPKGAPEIAWSAVGVSTTVDFGAGLNVSQARMGRLFDESTTAKPGGKFELKGLHAGRAFSLVTNTSELPLVHTDGLELEPGEHRQLTIQMQLGATLAGRILDDQGVGIEGAALTAGSGAQLDLQAQREMRYATSSEDGNFRISGIAPGELKLSATAGEFLQGKPLELVVAAGEVREGLEVILERGAEVRGRVVDVEGAAVVGAAVELSFDPAAMNGMNAANASTGATGSATTGADGSFRIRGLGLGPFQLEATRVGESEAWSYGRLAGVRPGSLELVLTIRELAPFVGRVVDAADEPIPSFVLELNPGSLGGLMGGNRMTEAVEDPEGRFQLERVKEGKWNLYVRSDGYGRAGPISVDRPGPGDSEVLVRMTRGVIARGVVVGPDERPVGGATVMWKADAGDLVLNLIGVAPSISDTTDDQGLFELRDLPAGSLSLTATAEAWASAEPLALQAAPDELLEDLRFQLRVGGSITGEVLDDEGGHEVGALIQIQQPGGGNQTITRTDSKGAFLAERLEPGKWQVVAIASDTDTSGNPAELLKNLKMDMVDVVDGQNVHVILGSPPTDPVHVFGQVEPSKEVQGGIAIFIPEGDNLLGSMRMASLDEAGRFELDLDGPGKYVITIQRTPEGGVGQDNVEFQEEIPAQPEVRLTLALPRGAISGQVVNTANEPLGAVRVSLYADGGTSTGTMSGGKYTETMTEADGSYEIAHLRPGTYTVGAGGRPITAIFDDSGDYGREVRSGIQVKEGQRRTGIDFELDAAGAIVGHVRDSAGQPVSGASLFVHDQDGILLERISLATTSGDGSFHYAGVAAGSYTVSARSKTEASPAAVAVQVQSGKEASVELGLTSGTILLVSVVDGENEPLSASLRVIDADGHDVAGQFGMSDLMEMLSGGFSTSTQRFGPLPPGKYQVFGDSGELSAKKPLTLSGQPERRIKLRLK